MLKRNRSVWILLALVSLAVGAAYAKSPATATDKGYRFEQELEGEIGGKVLKPGLYNVVITYENAQKGKMAVFKNKQLVVELPCDIEKTDLKLDANSVAYGKTPDGKRYIRWLYLRDRGEKVIIATEHP